jgi:diacylglycerol kinase (ATP)
MPTVSGYNYNYMRLTGDPIVSQHCTLIINPVSGRYTQQKLRKVRAALETGGFTCELLLTKSADDAALFARRISLERGEPFVVAGGGDGTVNGVINGLEPGKAVLAVLPLGTANVLAAELGINSLDDAVARIVRGNTRPLTVGLLRADRVERRFLLMAGIGMDGRIVEQVRESEKRRVGKGAYLLSAAREMKKWERESFEVIADGSRIACHSLIVCNAARYGGRFILAPGADIFAPGLRAACMTGTTRSAYLRLALSVVSGRVVKNSDVTFVTAAELAVSGKRAVQVDGDYCCSGPLRITAEAGFCRLIV